MTPTSPDGSEPGHRSRVQGVILDHPTGAADEALCLWRELLGQEVGESKAPTYYELGRVREVDVVLQRTGGDQPGAHLDIETDDLEAEVRRLEAAGAVLVEQVEDHYVLRDPGGLHLCVVPVTDAGRFDEQATRWPQA